MSEKNLQRRSTRLTISIPIVISGVDSYGNNFSETTRTLVVNKHGAKIATAHDVPTGTEVLIENRAIGVTAKATIVWMGGKRQNGEIQHAGLQLLEAQNVWGIAFPPEDWSRELQDEEVPAPQNPTTTEGAHSTESAMGVPSLAGEEIATRLLQELQGSADAYAREFQDRLKQLTERLGLELEIDFRERASHAKARTTSPLEEEVKVLRESLDAAQEQIRKLEAQMQELHDDVRDAGEVAPPPPLEEARRQLAAMAKAVVESMNRAAQAGLNEYQELLRKENQKSSARMRATAAENPSVR
jgi:hypothetical protein